MQAGEVRVAVATNFLATLKALTPIYEQQTGDKLIVSSASTGKLYAQIVNGAPFDLFLSADQHHPNVLLKLNKAVAQSRFIYATGQLVLWSRRPLGLLDQRSLDEVSRLAIANPRTSPYGLAAQQVLQKRERWQSLKSKLVYGENIGQAFQFVASANAPLGFVSLSQVLNPNNAFSQTDYWLVPQEDYEPLRQVAVLLQRGRDSRAAKRFLAFLKSDAARGLMAQYGYL